MAVAKSLAVGAIAGCVATVPMTLVMEVMHRQLPSQERYPLPPREVTMKLARQAEVSGDLDEADRQNASLVAHFGMGTAMGILYGGLGRVAPVKGPAAGAAVGLAVWAGNYLGLLPALGLIAPATGHPPRRTAVMVAAHLVWGATTGFILQSVDQPHSTSDGSMAENAQTKGARPVMDPTRCAQHPPPTD